MTDTFSSDKMTSTIWVARHGHRFDFAYPQWFNTALRRYDPPLSALGKTQAHQLGLELKNESIEHIIVSPFLRTIQTGHIIAEILNLPLKLEEGLGEWHNPDWMTEKPLIHPPEELRLFYPLIDWKVRSRSAVLRSNLTPIYPETEAIALERIKKITTILTTQFKGNLLLIGHSITVKGVAQALLDSTLETPINFCSCIKIIKPD